MKLVTVFLVILLTACIPRPPQIAAKPIMNELIDDGSKEMKKCKFECQKERTQCEIKNNTADSFNSARSVYEDQRIPSIYNEIRDFSKMTHDFSKELSSMTCQSEFESCFKEICGGKVMVKQ